MNCKSPSYLAFAIVLVLILDGMLWLTFAPKSEPIVTELSPPSSAAPPVLAAAPPAPAPPRSEGEMARFYAHAAVLESRETPPDSAQITRTTRLLRVEGEKYPLLRVEESWQPDPASKSPHLLTRQAMVADHVMVKLANGITETQAALIAAQHGVTIRSHLRGTRIYLFALPDAHLDSAPNLVRALGGTSPVEVAEPDWIVHASQAERTPNDEYYSLLWGLNNTGQTGGTDDADIDAPAAWALYTGTREVKVGIIDTGIDYNHPDLAANIWQNPGEIPGNGIDDDHNGYIDDVRGWNFVKNTADAMDDNEHGTHCAGTIGAVADNGIGVAGVAWNVKLVPLKFLSATGSGATSDAIEAEVYATGLGLDLTSNSWGGDGYSALLKEVIEDAGAAGHLFIAAAGNSSVNMDITPEYPAAYDSANIVSVAASDHRDLMAYFSNYGPTTVDLAAPGLNIASTIPGGEYEYLSGTSMAVPHVSGACALLKGLQPDLTVAELKARLLAAVDVRASFSKTVSGGRLNLQKLITAAAGPTLILKDLAITDSGPPLGILNPGETATLQLTLEAGGSEGTTGIAVDLALAGTPPGVTITQTHSDFPDLALSESAPGATAFSLEIDPSVTTPLALDLVFTVTSGGGHTTTFHRSVGVYRQHTITGTVTRLGDSAPLEGATVSAYGPVPGSQTTDADGAYTLSIVEGDYQVVATSPGYQASAAQEISVPPDAANVDFALGRAAFSIDPGSLEVTLNQGQRTARPLTITNSGTAPLTYTVTPQLADISATAADFTPLAGPGETLRDGFESGNILTWQPLGDTVEQEVTDTVAATGLYSLYGKHSETGGHSEGILHGVPNGSLPKNVSFNVRLANTQDAAGYFVLRNSLGFDCIWFFAAPGGKFYVNNDKLDVPPDFTYEPLRWYSIEFRHLDWIAKTFDFYVDGRVILENIPMRNPANTTGADNVDLHNYSPNSEAWWDNIVVGDLPIYWLDTQPRSGTVAPGGTAQVDVSFDAGSLDAGDHAGTLHFETNVPGAPSADIAALLHVQALPNTAPVALPQNVALPENTDSLITLGATDPDDNLLQATITTFPGAGSLFQATSAGAAGNPITAANPIVTDSQRRVVFRPAPGTSGNPYATFNFKVSDGFVFSNVATVTLQVTALPDAPVAVDDIAYSANPAPIIGIPVLANDFDPDGGTLSLIEVEDGGRGTASIVGNTITYTPDATFKEGIDEFFYAIQNPSGLTAVAKVSVHLGQLQGGDWGTLGVNDLRDGYYPATLGAGTLARLWSRHFLTRMSPPVLGQGRVFLTGATARPDQKDFYAIDAATGADLWTQDLGDSGVLGFPTWFNGILLTQTGGTSSTASNLMVTDAGSGQNYWTVALPAITTRMRTSVVNDDGIWVNSGNSGVLHGFNYDSSAKFQNAALGTSFDWAPAYQGGALYTYNAGRLRAIDPETGTQRWSWFVGSTTASSTSRSYPVIAGNRAYVWGGKKLYAGSLDTHTTVWTYTSPNSALESSPAVHDGIVYLTDGADILALDGQTGALLHTYATGDPGVSLQPVILDDVLITTGGTKTYIFNLATGALLQTLPEGGDVAVADGALIISSGSNDVHCYRFPGVGNTPPVPYANAVHTGENTQATITLAGFDADGDLVHTFVSQLPQRGQLYQTDDGATLGEQITTVPTLPQDTQNRVIYVPAPDSVQSDFFALQAGDGKSISGAVLIPVTIDPIGNHAPIALPDEFSSAPGQLFSPVPVLENDYDVDGGALTLIAVTQPETGTVQLSGGLLSYQPPEGMATGDEHFTYTVQDATGLQSVGNVIIHIQLPAQDWPTYATSPARAGQVSGKFGPAPWNLAWSRSLPGVHLNEISVVGNKLYLTPSTAASEVMALDADTGAPAWTYPFDAPAVSSAPVIHSGKVYLQNDRATGGNFFILDSQTGAELLKTQLPPTAGPFGPLITPEGISFYNSLAGALTGLTEGGAERFAVPYPNGLTVSTPGAGPAGTLYTWVGGTFRAHDPVAGAQLWSLTPDVSTSATANPPLIVGHQAFVTHSGSKSLYAIDLISHAVAWIAFEPAFGYSGSPAAANGLLYAFDNTAIHAFDAATGARVNSFSATSPGGPFLGHPIVTDDLVIGHTDTQVLLFNRRTGALLQSIAGESATLANGLLYIYSAVAGELQAYRAPAGLTFSPDGASSADPVDVTITATTPGSTIYYSLNGTDPSGSKRTIASGDTVRIRQSGVLRAVAISPTGVSSALEQATYTITDSDNDYLPDWWETLHYSSVDTVNGAEDLDGDGFTTADEFAADTDPQAPNSYLALTGVSRDADGTVHLRWTSVPGRAYVVEFSADLQSWQSLSGELAGTGGPLTFTHLPPGAAGAGYYRVRASD